MTDHKLIIDYLAYNGIFYLINEPMKRHTTFQIGGAADIVAYPTRRREICDLMRVCAISETPLTVLGNGSNVLINDKGLQGLVLMTDRLHRISVLPDNTIEAWAGAHLSKVAAIARNYSLAGLEFAFGIPGTVGGAIYMNAGAYNRQMNNVVIETEYVSEEGKLETLRGDEHRFGYRTSFFKNTSNIVIKTFIRLTEGNPAQINEKMNQYTQARRDKQPLELPSAGSIFKRPEGYFAGKLIEDCGLKGKRMGGAMVSEKHAGFIVNTGGATSRDVQELIEHIQKEVYQQFGVQLETEVRFLG